MSQTQSQTHIKKIKAKSSIQAVANNNAKDSADAKNKPANDKVLTVQEPSGCRVLGIY